MDLFHPIISPLTFRLPTVRQDPSTPSSEDRLALGRGGVPHARTAAHRAGDRLALGAIKSRH
eukprot:4434574-Prymnesium_polylepis.1